MPDSSASPFDRLMAVASQAEAIMARGIASHDIRQACALANGYLELARSYGEPVSLEAVERLMDRLSAALQTALPHSPDDDDFLARERA